MAIDDNTSYELTGYQVKDLAGRIRRKADASAIPTVNDATLTLVQNGTTVGTFTANQSTNTTVNLAGGIYADDPTAPANPDGWITPDDIDWSTFTYSTSEQRVGTWIDGKPIYKKTVYFASVASGDVNSAHGISNLSLAIKHEAFFISNGAYIPVPSLVNTSGGNYFAIWSINATNVHTFSSIPLQNFYVTIWYTKTTD